MQATVTVNSKACWFRKFTVRLTGEAGAEHPSFKTCNHGGGGHLELWLSVLWHAALQSVYPATLHIPKGAGGVHQCRTLRCGLQQVWLSRTLLQALLRCSSTDAVGMQVTVNYAWIAGMLLHCIYLALRPPAVLEQHACCAV